MALLRFWIGCAQSARPAEWMISPSDSKLLLCVVAPLTKAAPLQTLLEEVPSPAGGSDCFLTGVCNVSCGVMYRTPVLFGTFRWYFGGFYLL
jgi:hypothetical protein